MNTQWTAVIFASLFSGAALAAGGADFQTMDKNGDGYISQDEAQGNSSLQTKWNDADLNDDGQLDRAEFSQFESAGGAGTGSSGSGGYGSGSGTMNSPGGSTTTPSTGSGSTGTGTTP